MSAEFACAIRDSGIPICEDSIINDGKLHRVHVEGDKVTSRNAWYVFYGTAGAFGCNKRGLSGKWRADGKREPLTQYDYTRIEAARRARAVAQERGYSDAAERAEQILKRATRDASEHPYIVRKRVQTHAIKSNEFGLLVIPIYSALNGKLQTIQTIDRDGGKKMLKGGRLTDGCFPFQDRPDFWRTAVDRIGLAEGFATAATLAESLPTVAMFAAFSAGNLANVARALRARYLDAQITLYGDNDPNGVGEKCAIAAALAVDGLVALAPLVGTDWNDYAAGAGA